MHDFDQGYPDWLRLYDGGTTDDVVSCEAYGASQTSIRRLPPQPRALTWGPAPWCLADEDPDAEADADRRRRVALYKSYAAQGKVKASIRKAFRWVKDLVQGW